MSKETTSSQPRTQSSGKPRIALLTTGGTIVQQQNERGSLEVAKTNLLELVPEAKELADITVIAVANLDSTNITASDRASIAQAVYSALQESYDGIVITHGTDSMAKTGSYLSFALPEPQVPVVMTGSQLPLRNPRTDARKNLLQAIEAASGPYQGYAICFDDQLLQANRTIKQSSERLGAFKSPRAKPIATFGTSIDYDDTYLDKSATTEKNHASQTTLDTALNISYSTGVEVHYITTDDDPERLRYKMAHPSAEGLLIAGLGSGNIPDRLASTLEEIVADGKPVVIVSSCIDGAADLTAYEVGRNALDAGAISGRDMTVDACQMKLGIAIGTAKERYATTEERMAFVRDYMETCVAGEYTEKKEPIEKKEASTLKAA